MKLGEHGGSYGSLFYTYPYKTMEMLFGALVYDKVNISLCVMQFEIM